MYARACDRQESWSRTVSQRVRRLGGCRSGAGGCMGGDLGPRERWRLAHQVLGDGQAPGVRRVCLGGADDAAGALRGASFFSSPVGSSASADACMGVLVRTSAKRSQLCSKAQCDVVNVYVTYTCSAACIDTHESFRGREGHRRQRQSHLRVRKGRRHARRGRELRLSAEPAVARAGWHTLPLRHTQPVGASRHR